MDKLICAVESGIYEGTTSVAGEEHIKESMFFAKLVIQNWFNAAAVTELEEYLYQHALLFLIEFLDLAALGGLKGCWSDTGYMLSSGQAGRCIFGRKDGRRISHD